MSRILWSILLVVGMAGCSGLFQAKQPHPALQVWQERTSWGEVTVRQARNSEGVCSFREVTLRRRSGLVIDGRPTFVRATDYFCDDRFERWQFRSDEEAFYARRDDLGDLLRYLMHQVLPFDEHVYQRISTASLQHLH